MATPEASAAVSSSRPFGGFGGCGDGRCFGGFGSQGSQHARGQPSQGQHHASHHAGERHKTPGSIEPRPRVQWTRTCRHNVVTQADTRSLTSVRLCAPSRAASGGGCPRGCHSGHSRTTHPSAHQAHITRRACSIDEPATQMGAAYQHCLLMLLLVGRIRQFDSMVEW